MNSFSKQLQTLSIEELLAQKEGKANNSQIANLVNNELERRSREHQHELDLKLIAKQVKWNIISISAVLLSVVLGAAITIKTTHYFNSVKYQNEKKSIIIVIEKEVQQQLRILNNMSEAMEAIKAGKFPEIAKRDVTLDRAMEKGTTKIASGFGLTHESPLIESLLPNLKILPPEIIEDVLIFYASLRRCELKKLECEQSLNERINKKVEKPAPICEMYLTIVKDAIPTGNSLLIKLTKYNK